MRYISWDSFTEKGEITHHAVLHRIQPGAVQKMHGHEFAEVFWGLKGECTHEVNGEVRRFCEGELVILRASDIHELRCEGDKPFLYYLVSFPHRIYHSLKERYFSDGRDLWGEGGQQPLKYHLQPKVWEWMNAAVQDLLGNPDDLLAIERFLLNLLFETRRMEEEPYYACPKWLRDTLEKVKEPNCFRQGPRVLADISGRTYEHVSRVLKQHTGLKPSEYIGRVRIEYAAAKLVLTDIPISGIAFDCGFGTLARFYSLFKTRYSMTPRQYRLRYRCLID